MSYKFIKIYNNCPKIIIVFLLLTMQKIVCLSIKLGKKMVPNTLLFLEKKIITTVLGSIIG